MRRFIVKLLLIELLLRNSGKIHVCQTGLHPADWGRCRGGQLWQLSVCVCVSAAGRWPFSYYQSNHDIPVAWRCWHWWPLNTKYGAHTARCKHTPAFCESSSPLKVVGWKLRGKCKRSRWKREKPSVRMLSAHFPWSDSSNGNVVSQGFKLEARHFLASCCCYKISWNSLFTPGSDWSSSERFHRCCLFCTWAAKWITTSQVWFTWTWSAGVNTPLKFIVRREKAS